MLSNWGANKQCFIWSFGGTVEISWKPLKSLAALQLKFKGWHFVSHFPYILLKTCSEISCNVNVNQLSTCDLKSKVSYFCSFLQSYLCQTKRASNSLAVRNILLKLKQLELRHRTQHPQLWRLCPSLQWLQSLFDQWEVNCVDWNLGEETNTFFFTSEMD